MRRIKKFKLFEATEELIQDIHDDLKDRVEYFQDEFDDIEFKFAIKKALPSFYFKNSKSYMISIYIESVKVNKHGNFLTFKVNDILPMLKNINEFIEMRGLKINYVVSDSPNKPAQTGKKLEFSYEDVYRIYITWF